MKIRIIGMGALGLLFGSLLAEQYGNENVKFLMDRDRLQRHLKDIYTINGRVLHLSLEDADSVPADAERADLILVAVKYSGLEGAIRELKSLAGPQTVVVSLMNGIITEQIIGEQIGRDHLVDSVSIGMDAVRTGTDLTYSHMGRIQLGISGGEKQECLDRAAGIFAAAGVPYEIMEDIRWAMWNKFEINVGINQTCMVYDCDYGTALQEGSQIRRNLEAAMREVMAVGAAEGVFLSEDELQKNLSLLGSLNPSLYPSMEQDRKAKRRSEVELFSGTLLRLAEKHHMEVPVNRTYYQKVQEIEASY